MEPIIDFTPVYKFIPDCKILGVQSFRTENHNWVEMDSTESPEAQVQEAIRQGATELCLKIKHSSSDHTEFHQFDKYELLKDEWSLLKNKKMASKLRSGEAIDISNCEITPEGYYILDDFIEGKDYCVAKTEEWIWSVGISYKTGKILASTNSIFYENRDYECLFLR